MNYNNLHEIDKNEVLRVFIWEVQKIDKRISLNKETILETKNHSNSSQVEINIEAENLVLLNSKNFILSQIYEILSLIYGTYSILYINISKDYKSINFTANYQIESYKL